LLSSVLETVNKFKQIKINNMSKDYYKILEVNRNSSKDDIKKSYRRLSKKYHPDMNQNDKESESKFKEISEAYEILSDDNKKLNYDRFGSTTNEFNQNQGFGYDFNDIFSQFGDIFGGGRRSQKRRKGGDLRLKVSLTLNEIIKGCTKKLKYKRQDTCQSCSGKGGTDVRDCLPCNGSGRRVVVQNTQFGQMRQETGCPDCNGSGKNVVNKCGVCHGSGTTSKDEIVDVDIPKGVSSNMMFTMQGYGNHTRDGVPGDLQIVIDEIKEPGIIRDNNNLIIEKEVSVIDAIIGKNISVKTPHGDIPVTIEPGTDHGKQFRVRGKGVPDMNYGLGDLIVVVKIKIPKSISLDEKYILEKLKDSKNFTVS